MEQKDYKSEIVNELLKRENHVRGIAKNLSTNHMNIIRKIRELEKNNAVDYKKEGKNKTYFLKKTIEAKNHVFTAEIYKLNNLLMRYNQLRLIIDKIQKDNRIKLAVLFGSYSKGTAKTDSDIDIYMATENKKIKKEISLIDSKLSVKIGNYDKSNLLIKEIEKNHVIIKGFEKYYEKNKFFEES
ncbi:MAG: nucleotidyltransferase domain-containing protein [Nanoarchaeota archaeon]